jgi:hypothetical protein
MRFYLSDPALDCITCGFLQELYDIQKQQQLDYASAYLDWSYPSGIPFAETAFPISFDAQWFSPPKEY